MMIQFIVMVVNSLALPVKVVGTLIANHVWLDIIYKIKFALNVMMDARLVMNNQIIVKLVSMDTIKMKINV